MLGPPLRRSFKLSKSKSLAILPESQDIMETCQSTFSRILRVESELDFLKIYLLIRDRQRESREQLK